MTLPRAAVRARKARPRPHVHFTADDGWVNDPYGIVWTGDRYHLFYQAVPGQVVWGPNASWGHAESSDLAHWTQLAPALVPQPFELGCWSGSAVPADSGLRLFYTRVTDPDWGLAAIAVAHPAEAGWTSGVDDVLIPRPPDELRVRAFRDPFVFRHSDHWVMIVGAALEDGSGAAVQYRSPDLQTWTCDGLLASRLSSPADAVWTGSMWECPQLFPLEGRWVLLVSVWHDDVLHHCAAAVGDYDGHRFIAQSWQQLTYGSCAYAMAAFADRDGRRCVLSWLREEPQNDPTLITRAGAHSVPAVVEFSKAGELVLRPHPVLASATEATTYPGQSAGETRLSLGDRAADMTIVSTPGLAIHLADSERMLATLTFTTTELRVIRPGQPAGVVPIKGVGELRLLFDADLLEVFGEHYGAFRVGVSADPDTNQICIDAAHPEFTLRIV